MEKQNSEHKPQNLFKSFVRNNMTDNRFDFYSEKDIESTKIKIESISLDEFLSPIPNFPCKEYLEDSFEYIDKEERLDQICSQILHKCKALGIDIEQTNLDSYQGYNCLIQISTYDKNYIIDAIILHDVLPKYLKPICESRDIVKIFYSGASDLQWLNRDYGVFVVNFFDVYQASLFVQKTKDCSLIGLLNEYCNFTVSKESKKNFQTSDWRKRPLTRDQLNYAALDSHYLIYLRNILIEKIKDKKDTNSISTFFKKMQSVCLKPYEIKPFNWTSYVENFNKQLTAYRKVHKVILDNNQKVDFLEERNRFLKLCKFRDDLARKIDTNPDLICSLEFLFTFSIELPKDFSNEKIVETFKKYETTPHTLFKHLLQIEEVLKGPLEYKHQEENKALKGSIEKEKGKEIRRQRLEEHFTLKKQIYEGCRVLAPDGELLSYTNRKKLNWYLNGGHATLVQEDPLTIKLNFEPSGRKAVGLAEYNIEKNEYMKHNRINQCVVCGQQEKISRYHVVPSLYRQHFPSHLKERRAYDILLLCFRCREKANAKADQFKVEIAERYNVPLIEYNKSQILIQAAKSIQKTLSSYLKSQSGMPQDRRIDIENNICTIFSTLKEESLLSEETTAAFQKFSYDKEDKVEINQAFIDYFLKITNWKDFVEKNSNKDFKNIHGKLVVDKLNDQELKSFIDEWRMAFVYSMDPQFLPHDWNVVLRERAKVNASENKIPKE